MPPASSLRRILFTTALALLLTGPASAQYVVGFNADVHNGTGQNAYDFHVQGIVEGSLLGHYLSGNGVTPFDWTWNGLTSNGNTFNGGWSGTTAVATCETIHVGLSFSAGLNYMYDVVGWWTDASGNKLNPLAGTAGSTPGTYYSDVPILGFRVTDATNTLTLKNSTTAAITYRNIQVALSTSAVALSDLNQSSSTLAALSWHSADTAGTLASGSDVSYLLPSIGVTPLAGLSSANYLIITGEVFDPTIGASGDYRWFGEEHQVPEPSSYALVAGLLATALALRRRR